MNRKVEHLNALTGLRFVAASLVFVHHLDVRTGCAGHGYPLGAYAVGFFFVLSGFILTYAYRDRLKRDGVKRFYFSRWARIWPLHFVCLAFVLLAFKQHFQNPDNIGTDWLRLLSNAFLLQSLIPLTNFAFSFNAVSWSISTELFFYLLFPFLLAGGEKKFWRRYVFILLATVASATLLQWLSGSTALGQHISLQRFTQMNPLFRLVEFATGVGTGFLFLRHTERQSGQMPQSGIMRLVLATVIETVALAAVVALPIFLKSLNTFNKISTLPSQYEVLANWYVFSGGMFVFAGLIYLFGTSRGLWAKLFGSRTMVFLGEISFAFYMTHLLVLRIVRRWDWSASSIPPEGIGVCAFCISIGVSTLLFKIVEIPSRNALLKWWDGSCRDAGGVMITALREFFKSRFAVVTVLFCLALVVALSYSYSSPAFDPEMQEIIRQSPRGYRTVTFENGMSIRGIRYGRNRHLIEVDIVWQRITAHEVGRRYTGMFESAGGEMVRNGPAIDGEAYHQREVGAPFIETIRFPEAIFKEGDLLAIGFRGEGKRVTWRPGGPPVFNHAVQLISPEDLKELRAADQ